MAADTAFVLGSTPVPSKPSDLSLCWTSTRQHHPTTSPLGVCCAGSQAIPSPPRTLVSTVADLSDAPRQQFHGHGPQLPLTPGVSSMGLASPPLCDHHWPHEQEHVWMYIRMYIRMWMYIRILVDTVADLSDAPRQPIPRPRPPAATHPRAVRHGSGQPTPL